MLVLRLKFPKLLVDALDSSVLFSDDILVLGN